MIDNPRIKDIFEVNVSSVMRPISPLILVLGGTATFKTTHGG